MADDKPDGQVLLLGTPAVLIRDMCKSIAEAQRMLDEAAIATQKEIDRGNSDLSRLGYHVTWYQIPEAIIELKVAVHLVEEKEGKPSLLFGFFNAQNKASQAYTAETSSMLRLRVVPVPPPASTNMP